MLAIWSLVPLPFHNLILKLMLKDKRKRIANILTTKKNIGNHFNKNAL